MKHNPNPFDFVPFADKEPLLKTAKKWCEVGSLRSGRMTITMTALTPLHIVGEQRLKLMNGGFGPNIKESRFYKRGGKHYVPGSSIRGALRAFIEAASNGWASQLTPYYEEKEEKHAIGFTVVENETGSDVEVDSALPSAIKQHFTVPSSVEKGFDLASFLFGYIPGKPTDKNDFNPAWKGRLTIEDAEVAPEQLSSPESVDCPKVPDLDAQKSFMGGPHPRATSWWYQFPKEIRRDKYGAYKFIGSGFRGRKFYFHQNPANCIEYYEQTPQWKTNSKGNTLYFFPIECLKQGESVSFDLLFNGLPEELLSLLCFALEPGKNIRHKIGYGKAYGYGAVEFYIEKVEYRSKGFEEPKEGAIDEIRATIGEKFKAFGNNGSCGFTQFLDKPSLNQLSFILWYDANSTHLFTYPFAGSGGFNVDLNRNDRKKHNQELSIATENAMDSVNLSPPATGKAMTIKPAEAEAISRYDSLLEHKPALNFKVYQEESCFIPELKEARKFKYQ